MIQKKIIIKKLINQWINNNRKMKIRILKKTKIRWKLIMKKNRKILLKKVKEKMNQMIIVMKKRVVVKKKKIKLEMMKITMKMMIMMIQNRNCEIIKCKN